MNKSLSTRAKLLFALLAGIALVIIAVDQITDEPPKIQAWLWLAVTIGLVVLFIFVMVLVDRLAKSAARPWAPLPPPPPPPPSEPLWTKLQSFGVPSANLVLSGGSEPLPYQAPALYRREHPCIIGFGAYLSWPSWPYDDLLPALVNRLEQLTEEQRTALRLIDIDHQASGHACSQHSFIARAVEIAPAMLPFATTLCGHFYHANSGHFGAGEPGPTEEFHAMVRGAGLEPHRYAPRAGQSAAESIYPMAATDENIAKFVANHEIVKRQLAPLLEEPLLRERLILLLLAENSD